MLAAERTLASASWQPAVAPKPARQVLQARRARGEDLLGCRLE